MYANDIQNSEKLQYLFIIRTNQINIHLANKTKNMYVNQKFKFSCDLFPLNNIIKINKYI